jgi:hypothetical protein
VSFNGLSCRACNTQIKVVRGCEQGKCPVKMVTADSKFYLEAYGHYMNGYLPLPGGWMDQPSKMLQAINVVGAEFAKLEKEGS